MDSLYSTPTPKMRPVNVSSLTFWALLWSSVFGNLGGFGRDHLARLHSRGNLAELTWHHKGKHTRAAKGSYGIDPLSFLHLHLKSSKANFLYKWPPLKGCNFSSTLATWTSRATYASQSAMAGMQFAFLQAVLTAVIAFSRQVLDNSVLKSRAVTVASDLSCAACVGFYSRAC
jgi:hypothetical protein